MFSRKALYLLEKWSARDSRKPLVLRGARQVGKTQLVRLASERLGLDLCEVNLDTTKLQSLESDDFDLQRCLMEISAVCEKKIHDKTLIFLDEIQESSFGYSRLRYFKELRPELRVIAAGSLLELRLKREPVKIPVGRIEYLFLGPVTFEEFLRAQDLAVLADIISERDVTKLTQTVHQKISNHLKDYFFCGGMPEAVATFAKDRTDLLGVRDIHHQILRSYEEDMYRYASKSESVVLSEVFRQLPYELGRKVIHTRFSEAKSQKTRQALEILNDIFLLHRVEHSNASGLPLSKGAEGNVYKAFFIDVGLYNTLMGVGWDELFKLDSAELLNKGEYAEQFVAQHLALGAGVSDRKQLHFWLRDKGSHNAEIDFLQTAAGEVQPIEVKAGKSGSIKSLIRFMHERRGVSAIAIRYDLRYRENWTEECCFKLKTQAGVEEVAFTLQNLPLYFSSGATP